MYIEIKLQRIPTLSSDTLKNIGDFYNRNCKNCQTFFKTSL